ncbi:hypothetical protein N5U26_10135 [Aliarcobacter cryaerophilus]|jgi:integrase/recombinase XerD|nr:hypothetical protein [Aliarcobacter cryaerophilus]MCT7510716.1 hypothetical protein [Aliarcobacter cryaerophilus]
MLNFGPKSFTEIDEELLSDFLITETSKLSNATKNSYRTALITFFSYLDLFLSVSKASSVLLPRTSVLI